MPTQATFNNVIRKMLLFITAHAFTMPGAPAPRLLRATTSDTVFPFFQSKAAPVSPTIKDKITYQEVRTALRDWCDGIIEIGKVYKEGGDFKAKAMQHIEASYAFTHELGEGNQLLFKPTKASEHPFRSNFDEFVSYFVGDGKYSEDTGFAITPWTGIRFDMHGVYITDSSATVSGQYWFTNDAGDDSTETKVEYTFQFVRVAKPEGKLKIVLHHSSLPFSP